MHKSDSNNDKCESDKGFDGAESMKSHNQEAPCDAAEAEKGIPEEPETKHEKPADAEDFSVFTTGQKRAIVLTAAFASWFSPMTASIYFPALNQIAADLQVSSTDINLTVTTYLIVQGLAPMMIAGFSDKAGRRPAYIVCFAIYIVANLALALQDNYVALLILRMVQSAGSSGTVALANGVVGDLITSSERGKYVAWASLGSVLGPTLSPVIGGLISQYLDWHWLFWFLLILSAAFTIPFLLFMPETCRNIVGDGSVPPPWTSWNLSDHIRFKKREKDNILVDQAKLEALRKNYKITIPNPLASLKVLFSREGFLLLVPTGLAFALYYALVTGASEVFASVYGFDELDVGLIFLSIGGGSIIAAFTVGKIIDWNYGRHAKKLNMPIVKNRATDLSNFPIERARLEVGLPMLLFTAAVIIGYGWMMIHKISLAGPVIMLFLSGFCLIAGSQTLMVLMVDIYPGRPAAATAANNVARCLLGAGATAAIQPMSTSLGYGWAYTILSVIFLLSTPSLIVVMKYGIEWRKRAKTSAERKKAKLASRADQAKA
ncbi:hypothetical protein AMS68_001439 [Peltaster fructicola]|uniref:Major facilitator superfamily (MFS) profile domain-containing protein n=1 Tax=Peltaster fructicola TaxID=286661 RepID=A0A6H0XMD7_9PEZI|nr:hypothetical protein AMS68_001439 [Peltaster fructicola]